MKNGCGKRFFERITGIVLCGWIDPENRAYFDDISFKSAVRMKPELVFKKKARENFLLAKSCCATHPNAAGSRLYYAGFQVVVGELEKLGIAAHKIDRGAADAMDDRGQKWTHSF